MSKVADHLKAAQDKLAVGNYLLEGGFEEAAGREAYMAAFHAALAFIATHTDHGPKTHKGTHVEFARLARDNGLEPTLVSFLGRAFNFKTVADYEFDGALTHSEARAALDDAAHFIETISKLLGPAASPA